MDSNATDVVRVGLKHVYTFQGIIVEHADLHIILPTGKKEDKYNNTAVDRYHSQYYKNKNYHTIMDLQNEKHLNLYKYSL